MRRYGPMLPILGLILVSLMVGCSKAPGGEPADEVPESSTVTIVDALGRSVSWDGPPQRIVIAGKSNFFLNDAVYVFPSAPERVVALTKARQTTAPFLALLDPDYADKLILSPESTAEEIATTQPDVVLLKRFMRESVGEALETLGIPVVYLDLETPEQYERDLGVLGQIFGDPSRAQAVWEFYESRMSRIRESLTDLAGSESPAVLIVQSSVKGGEIAFEVPPESWIQTQMVTLAGGRPVWTEESQGGWTVVNLEQIAAWNPDVILVISYFEPVDTIVATLKSDATWQELTAVAQGRIFGFPGDHYSWDQPDSRWILGLTWMARTLHPDRFADLDMGDEINDFYTRLYGLDVQTIDDEILPLLQGDVTP
ncbi:MAG: ABC transporter substrate-binding protein [Anaerolineae bacterium]|nr:ABC transporter substrate-binding protein [Anaerolineae bacterium]